ncbi:DUF5643 domain-containing protein [Paenibacillus xylanilyticus]|uniref:DUF5643 domain-containing protein n=1 Tax=Paenibacillus xylanilyticus TaxID=248903 RepID=UPI0039A2880B
MNKIYRVMTTAALTTGMLLGGAAWGMNSTAVDAATAKVPAVQSTATQKAAKTAGITQSGITLGVNEATYDGNYIHLTLQRSGKGLIGGITDSTFDEEIQDVILEKGAIKKIDVSINGKSIFEYGGGELGKRPTLGWEPGSTPDTAHIKLTDPSWLGGQEFAFPDKFKLTAKVTLEGVSKPYTFDLSMQKTAGKPMVLKPNVTKKSGKMTLNLSKMNLTSTSSRVQLIEKGYESGKPSDFLYEFVDDQGKELDFLSGFGTDENNKAGDMYHDFVLSPLGKDTKSITLRVFKPEFKEQGATSGEYKLDENGEIVKNYIKELEMTVNMR